MNTEYNQLMKMNSPDINMIDAEETQNLNI